MCCFNLKPQDCVCSMPELPTKVKMSRRLRRSPPGEQGISAVLLESFLSVAWLFISYLFIYFCVRDWTRSRSLFSPRARSFWILKVEPPRCAELNC